MERGCAAAEFGELALRGLLRIPVRKSKVFGFDLIWSATKLQLLDARRSGLGWADELLAELERSAEVRVGKWLNERRDAFKLHRAALAERGVLGREAIGARGKERYFPNQAVREPLIAEVRAVPSGQRDLDAHMLFLIDLAERVLLDRIGVELSKRYRLDRGRGAGPVAAIPEQLRDTSAGLAMRVPFASSSGGVGV